jgi:hypothetical protein
MRSRLKIRVGLGQTPMKQLGFIEEFLEGPEGTKYTCQ